MSHPSVLAVRNGLRGCMSVCIWVVKWGWVDTAYYVSFTNTIHNGLPKLFKTYKVVGVYAAMSYGPASRQTGNINVVKRRLRHVAAQRHETPYYVIPNLIFTDDPQYYVNLLSGLLSEYVLPILPQYSIKCDIVQRKRSGGKLRPPAAKRMRPASPGPYLCLGDIYMDSPEPGPIIIAADQLETEAAPPPALLSQNDINDIPEVQALHASYMRQWVTLNKYMVE